MNKELLQGETLQGCKASPCRRKGFTLIELLVVIAILGILSAGILTAINVTSNLDKAKLAKAKTFSKSLENSLSVNQMGKWSFEEPSAPFKDTSGNGNDGQCLGASCPTFQDASQCGLGFGGCLGFDGNNYVQLPDLPEQENQPFSFSAWIYWTGQDASGIWGHFGPGNDPADPSSGNSHFEIWTSWGPGLRLRLGDRQNNPLVYNDKPGMPFPPVNEWTHVAFSYDGDATTTVYMHGRVLDSFVGKAGKIFGSEAGGEHTIGDSHRWQNISSRPFKGLIDEVQIYNQALTVYQIQHLYAQGLIRHQLARR